MKKALSDLIQYRIARAKETESFVNSVIQLVEQDIKKA